MHFRSRVSFHNDISALKDDRLLLNRGDKVDSKGRGRWKVWTGRAILRTCFRRLQDGLPDDKLLKAPTHHSPIHPPLAPSLMTWNSSH